MPACAEASADYADLAWLCDVQYAIGRMGLVHRRLGTYSWAIEIGSPPLS